MGDPRTIKDIYEHYHVPPNLALHMYRVAALGAYLAESLTDPMKVRRDFLITGCLLHDIGNIVKFDMGHVHDAFIQDHIEYYKQVQKEVFNRYGSDENMATVHIAQEVIKDKELLSLLGMTGLAKIQFAHETDDMTVKLFRYADERISPDGVVTVEERYDDIAKRYAGRDHPLNNAQYLKQRKKLVKEIEEQIQSQCTIDLQKVSDIDIEQYIEMLHDYKI